MRRATSRFVPIAAAGLAVIASTLTTVAAGAPTPVNETRSAPADGYVTVENILGSVTVTGWSKNQVLVTGNLGEGVESLEVENSGDRTHIEVRLPHRMDKRGWDKGEGEGWLEIKVPQGSDLRVNGVNLEIEITDVKGELELESVNGNIQVEGSAKEIRASAVNGSISLNSNAQRVHAEAVNGAVKVTGGSGELEASCVNGTVDVIGGTFDEASCSTVSGDITWSAGLGKRGSLSLDSHSGSVVLTLPKSTNAEFDVSTFSGKIVNELGPPAERTDEYAPGYELNFTLGEGSSQIDISSFSGKVEIRAAR